MGRWAAARILPEMRPEMRGKFVNVREKRADSPRVARSAIGGIATPMGPNGIRIYIRTSRPTFPNPPPYFGPYFGYDCRTPAIPPTVQRYFVQIRFLKVRSSILRRAKMVSNYTSERQWRNSPARYFCHP